MASLRPSKFTVTHPDELPRAADPAANTAANYVADLTRRYTPVDTGRLAAGWRVTHDDRLGSYVVSNDVPYAKHVEFGTHDDPPAAMMGRAAADARARYGSR